SLDSANRRKPPLLFQGVIHSDVLLGQSDVCEQPLSAGPARAWISGLNVLRRRDHFVERRANRPNLRREDLGQRAALRAEYRSAREQRLDRRQSERLIPLRRHPETARAREQHRLAVPAHFSDVLEHPGKTWTRTSGHDHRATPP